MSATMQIGTPPTASKLNRKEEYDWQETESRHEGARVGTIRDRRAARRAYGRRADGRQGRAVAADATSERGVSDRGQDEERVWEVGR